MSYELLRKAGSGGQPGCWGDGFAEARQSLLPHEAWAEANRCLGCYDAPCRANCPAGVDVPGFIRRLKTRNFLGAGLLIRKANVLGGTCARVCPAEVLCEKGCRDRGMARPIAIAALQRFACDATVKEAVRALPGGGAGAPTGKARRERVAVLGAGPAGLAAAVELRRLGVEVTVFERARQAGGMLGSIPTYRLPRSVWEEEVKTAVAGIDARLGEAPVSLEDLSEFGAVIVAVGMGDPQVLDVPGADLAGVRQALPFLKEVNAGARPQLKGRVAVIGGGNVAIDAACTARRLGATEVKIVYRRGKADMPAWPHEVVEAEEDGVEFMWYRRPVRILGEQGRVTGLEVQETRPGEPDASGRRRPVPVPGSEQVLPVDTVILALGQQRPRLPSGPQVFVAGDAASGGATVVQAVGEGKRAAQAAWRYLQDKLEQ